MKAFLSLCASKYHIPESGITIERRKKISESNTNRLKALKEKESNQETREVQTFYILVNTEKLHA